MSTFDASQGLFNQYHFTVVEIDIPIVEGSLSESVADSDPTWNWRLNEISGFNAVDVMKNGNLVYESNSNTADYSVAASNFDGIGVAKDINGDATKQIFDPLDPPININSFEDSVYADGPEWYWKLDETTGVTFVDAMGNDDLTSTGTSAATLISDHTSISSLSSGRGSSINCKDFTGTQYITGGNSVGSMPVSGSWSIELAFATSVGSGGQLLAGHQNQGYALAISSVSTDRITLTYKAGGTTYEDTMVNSLTSHGMLVDVTGLLYWNYVSLVVNTVNDTIKLYFNNTLVMDVDISARSKAWDTSMSIPFGIGSFQGAVWNLNGGIDEVQVYHKALTDSERNDHYSWWSANASTNNAIIGSLTTSDFTIEGAFFISTATLNMHFLGKMDNTIEYAIRLDSANNNILKFDLFQSDNTDRSLTIVPSLSAAGVTADDAWHWISIRMDHTGAALLTCEIDSVERSSIDVSTWSGDWRQDVLSRFTIGADGKDGTNIWNGGIDEISIYLKSITDEQRLSNYGWWSGDITIIGFGTPLSSVDEITGTRTYKFVTSDAPPLTESGIHRNISSINETVAKLNLQAGLASRGSGKIILVDFKGDPNPGASEVTEEVIAASTFLAKLDARNILTNRDLRIKNYRLEADGSMDLANGAETRHYIIESFDNLGGNKWGIRFKDELSRVNLKETIFPASTETTLTADIDNSTTTIPVNDGTLFSALQTVRIGEELMKIVSISVNNLIVGTRGSDIVYTNTLSKTEIDEHEDGDEVFICDVCDNENIDLYLARVLIAVGVDASFIPTADWATEIADWHPNDKLNTLWIESFDTLDILKKVLGDYLLDMWFDPVAREIKLSAVSQWKEASITITEGNEIEFETIRRVKEESLRYTRALVVYDKRFLAKTDSVENFKKAALFKRTDLETVGIFGEIKVKQFPFSALLSKNAAELLVNRYVSRNVNPHSYKWLTPEKKLNYDVGDVVNIISNSDVDFNGSTEAGSRAQIMSISPKYSGIGREYSITALSYQPVLGDSEIVITGNIFNLNLHTHVGAPIDAVEMTFVFNDATIGSTSATIAAMVAGSFHVDSKIIIILANGADLQGRGGKGGVGKSIGIGGGPSDGEDGGIVYDAQGIDTDIYFSGSTPSTAFPTADGTIFAPSGGGGGFNDTFEFDISISGDGGDGGDGINPGDGGRPGFAIDEDDEEGEFGSNGHIPPVLAVVGDDNNATGGLAGSGVIDNGAIVVFFPTTPSVSEYLNGNGDH